MLNRKITEKLIPQVNELQITYSYTIAGSKSFLETKCAWIGSEPTMVLYSTEHVTIVVHCIQTHTTTVIAYTYCFVGRTTVQHYYLK